MAEHHCHRRPPPASRAAKGGRCTTTTTSLSCQGEDSNAYDGTAPSSRGAVGRALHCDLASSSSEGVTTLATSLLGGGQRRGSRHRSLFVLATPYANPIALLYWWLALLLLLLGPPTFGPLGGRVAALRNAYCSSYPGSGPTAGGLTCPPCRSIYDACEVGARGGSGVGEGNRCHPSTCTTLVDASPIMSPSCCLPTSCFSL